MEQPPSDSSSRSTPRDGRDSRDDHSGGRDKLPKEGAASDSALRRCASRCAQGGGALGAWSSVPMSRRCRFARQGAQAAVPWRPAPRHRRQTALHSPRPSCAGSLTNGVEFDSSRARGEKFSFKIGTGQVCADALRFSGQLRCRPPLPASFTWADARASALLPAAAIAGDRGCAMGGGSDSDMRRRSVSSRLPRVCLFGLTRPHKPRRVGRRDHAGASRLRENNMYCAWKPIRSRRL